MKDKFSQKIYQELTMSNTDTLTFAEFNIGISLHENLALLIHQIDYYVDRARMQEIAAATDELRFGISTSGTIPAIVPNDHNIVDMVRINLIVAASPEVLKFPLIKRYNAFPSGGIIVPARPLYLACMTEGFGNAVHIECVIHFLYKKLSGQEFLELVQATRIIA